MNFTGKIKDILVNWITKKVSITFDVNEPSALNEIQYLRDCEKLSIKIDKYRKKRSLNANAMLWACLSDIANALNTDKWDIYLMMLKRYGKFTYICVKPNVVEAVKSQWRECEEIGTIYINGQESVQLLCYFGSHTYNTKEFSILLNGVISEMKEMGLTPPPTADMKRALEQWEKSYAKHNTGK